MPWTRSSTVPPQAACRQLTGAATIVRILTIVTSRADRQPASAADPDRAATLQLIIALGRALQALEQVVGPHLVQHGLSLTEFAVLEVLHHKGPLRLGEVRDRRLPTVAGTSDVVQQ